MTTAVGGNFTAAATRKTCADDLTRKRLAGPEHFDPYPFTLLTLVVSLEAIFLSAFILISQNYELRLSDRRSQLDLQINLLTEQENTQMIQMLERIAEKVGVDVSADADIQLLKEAIEPEKLIAQIEQAQQENPLQPSSTWPPGRTQRRFAHEKAAIRRLSGRS